MAQMSGPEILLSGTILYGLELEPVDGYLCLKDGLIKEVGEGKVDSALDGVILPCFVNAHVHIGDSAFKDPPFLPLAELVGPGGMKHRMLEQLPRERIVEGMKRTLQDMLDSGTCAFADFREGGANGVEMALEAGQQIPLIGRILGRPEGRDPRIHEGCWGLGISSARDYEPEFLEEATRMARRAGQVVAIHAGEAGRDDLEAALALEPDLLVHLSKATRDDLKRVADAGIPVVVCPRSNLVTGSGLPDVKEMTSLGITVGVGTDNVMLNSPNIFAEIEILCKALLHDDRQVFKMCTLSGARILGIEKRVGYIGEGMEGRVMVIDRGSNNIWGSLDVLASVVRRGRPSDIKAAF
jgi:cytosine/adenosine deaminase-related metal-dependent hydrolase